jgi:hypothetical protein
MTKHSTRNIIKLGSGNIYYDEWKRRIDLLSASFGEADKEFVRSKMIDMEVEKPVKTLKKLEEVRDTPGSALRTVEVD